MSNEKEEKNLRYMQHDDLLGDILTLNRLDAMDYQMDQHVPLKHGKAKALHILKINIEYAKSHTPYKAYKRILADILPYENYKPFSMIKAQLDKYKTADDLIGDFMDDERYKDSDTGVDLDEEHDYDSICNYLGKKQNYYKIYKDLLCMSFDSQDYKPLTQKDMVAMLEKMVPKVKNFVFPVNKATKTWKAIHDKMINSSNKD